jgi:hypothetical protein
VGAEQHGETPSQQLQALAPHAMLTYHSWQLVAAIMMTKTRKRGVMENSFLAFPVAADLPGASYTFSDLHKLCNIHCHAN